MRYKIIQDMDVLKELEANEARRKKIVTEKIIMKVLWCLFLSVIIAVVYLFGNREDMFLSVIEMLMEHNISRESAEKYILLFFVALALVLIITNLAEVFTKNFRLATKEEMIRKGAKYSKKYLHQLNLTVENEVLEYVAEMPDPATVWVVYKKPDGVVKRVGFIMQVVVSDAIEKDEVIINFDDRTVTYSYENKDDLGNEHAKGYKGNVPVEDICDQTFDASVELDTVEDRITCDVPVEEILEKQQKN